MPAFLASPMLKLGVIVVICAGLFAYRGVLIHERNSARAEVAKLTTDLATCRANTATLEKSVQDQNAAIVTEHNSERLIAQEARAHQAAAAQAGAAAAASAAARAQAIEHSQIQPGCAAAITWGRAQAPGLSRW
jgi:peptidoglycan hydrolase CwlO-like protein